MSTLKTVPGFFVLVFFLFFIQACTKNSDSAKTGTHKGGEVHLAIWGGYFSDESKAEFEKLTEIKIKISNYASNEELLAKVQLGGSGVDVAVPSDYMVDILRKSGKLELLDQTQISQIKQIDPAYLKLSYDSQNQYSVPYAWSTAGIAVNRDLYKDPITSWKDLYDNSKLAGKMALLDDPREVVGSVLKMLGFSVNSINPEEIKAVKEILFKAKKNVKVFSSNSVDLLVNKEVAVAQVFSTDANQANMKMNGKIEYIIPKEGGTKAIDNLVIIKGAKHIREAHQLINFLLTEKANISFVKNLLAGPILRNTKALLPPKLQANKALFPDQETLRRLERIEDLGDKNKIYEDLWTEVKTH